MSQRIRRLGESNSAQLHQLLADIAVNIATFNATMAIGIANAQELPCALIGGDSHSDFASSAFMVRNLGANDFTVNFNLPGYPTNRNGLKLYILEITIGISDSDATDYVDRIRLRGNDNIPAGTTVFDKDHDIVKGTDIGVFTYDENDDVNFPFDMSSYEDFTFLVTIVASTTSQIEIAFFKTKIYYDD